MKTTVVALMAGAILVISESFGLMVLAASGERPPLIEYWGPISAIGVALVAFATLRATLIAHKDHTESALREKATKDELVGLMTMMQSIHTDLRDLRSLVEERLSA